jgi:hypothetical protein
MALCTVVHVRKAAFDEYIGRSFAEFHESPWHNPFHIEPGCGRDCVIQRFRQYLINNPSLMARLSGLKGKTLGCWCKPRKACHGDVIAQLVNALLEGD